MFCLRVAAMARSIEQHGHHMTCALIGTSRQLQLYEQPSCALNEELVDANGVCQGIQKVRVGPATRSAVATCNLI